MGLQRCRGWGGGRPAGKRREGKGGRLKVGPSTAGGLPRSSADGAGRAERRATCGPRSTASHAARRAEKQGHMWATQHSEPCSTQGRAAGP
eukprot:CAMPEP_0119466632 /NCGR_PEP_ID=MMETSP1344-20130328/1202_1 /TAXON_ID=236787 /ORGANISM="Florenciella parvula, Strain CCMP2471" /LENGTH=90 /DNA_ID=CAMNT_0007498961 /DNA_START=122 /DNA_END=394 /DNA_ORIENTATION=+